jgi:CHAT domain-containing protein
VFGLRRAFHIAGAHTVIMSLWPVEDETARRWMEALYEARLSQKLDTVEAVYGASRTVLRERRDRGQSIHPVHWAGFVAAGDWR